MCPPILDHLESLYTFYMHSLDISPDFQRPFGGLSSLAESIATESMEIFEGKLIADYVGESFLSSLTFSANFLAGLYSFLREI
jgi:hypothetical protein